MACHSHDPGMPPSGYGGIDRAPGTVDGMKKFIEIVDSSYHRLNFCQGMFSEMCRRPRQEDLRRHPLFGERRKIFMAHSRNIRGKRLNFEETYIDEGDVDM